MMRNDFYGHEDFYQLTEITTQKRISNRTKRFEYMAENIGQYQTIDTPQWFGVRFNKQTRHYEYLAVDTKQLYSPFTYASYARYAVQQWLNSPHHRANLLEPSYGYVGCAGRLSANPYQQRRAPFGRLVQNFGSERNMAQVSR